MSDFEVSREFDAVKIWEVHIANVTLDFIKIPLGSF